jgi:cell division septal protein FtsQ
MLEQNQHDLNQEENKEEAPLTQQIERETSRLDPNPLEKLKKKIRRLYGWIWALLGIVAFLFIIFILLKWI